MKLKQIIWERDNYTCHYCGREMKALYELWKAKKIKRLKALLSIDHVFPKSKGGTWDESNLVTCCIPCNNKKAQKILTNIL